MKCLFWLVGVCVAYVSMAAIHPLTQTEQAIFELQVCLERQNFSCNQIDAQAGLKTSVAFATWCAVNGKYYRSGMEPFGRALYFARETNFTCTVTIEPRHLQECVKLPETPAEKAKLSYLGYETLLEMFAEKGHCSQVLLQRLNPALDWPNPPVGSQVVLPQVIPEIFLNMPKAKHFPYGRADVIRVSLSRLEVTAFNEEGVMIGFFPCSIAADKNKLPPAGEIHVATLAEDPNYTYTDRSHSGGKKLRYILSPGPNNPVGTSWIGLSLPSYGIHGTPYPNQIGRAESHGCIRLSNWNADKLCSMCEVGTNVVIER